MAQRKRQNVREIGDFNLPIDIIISLFLGFELCLQIRRNIFQYTRLLLELLRQKCIFFLNILWNFSSRALWFFDRIVALRPFLNSVK